MARSYETKDGEKRTVYELDVDKVGPSLRNASAKVTKATRTSAQASTGERRPAAGRAGPVGLGARRRVQRRAAFLATNEKRPRSGR